MAATVLTLAGKQCVLLYAGDFDPHGLLISEHLRRNLDELAQHPDIRWTPDRLIIDRFALTADFIRAEQLPWIDGLTSGSGADLAQSTNRHIREYVQTYGVRKVEANALVVRPDAGRALLRQTIAQYLDVEAPRKYERRLQAEREALRREVARRMGDGSEVQ